MAVRITLSGAQERGKIVEGAVMNETRLKAQHAERLAKIAEGDVIVSTGGLLWITQEGDREDYFLRQGERFTAQRRGVVVVEAMTDAGYRISKN